jgi:hypothetical protein
VVVPKDKTDKIGMVYVQDATGQESPGMVMNTLLRSDELLYGAPVLVTWDGKQFKIAGRNDELWTEFFEGVYLHDQRVVSIDQLDYATLHPTSPTPSMFAVVSDGVYSLNNNLYFIAAQLTQDFTSLVPATNGKAKAYLVEVDPTDGTLYYTAGAEFPAELGHEQAFAGGFYPSSVTAGRFLIGWVVLVKGMSALESGRYLFNAPEFLSKGQDGTVNLESGGTEADLSATGPGHVIQASAGAALSILKHNLAASTAPTADDDSGDGYAVGSVWVDTTNDKAYICLDPTATAAVWTETTQSGAASMPSWETKTTDFTAVANGRYKWDTAGVGAKVCTLPATFAVDDTVEIYIVDINFDASIEAASGDTIGETGSSISLFNQPDYIKLQGIVANTDWAVVSANNAL